MPGSRAAAFLVALLSMIAPSTSSLRVMGGSRLLVGPDEVSTRSIVGLIANGAKLYGRKNFQGRDARAAAGLPELSHPLSGPLKKPTPVLGMPKDF